jgi:hypothetical protein
MSQKFSIVVEMSNGKAVATAYLKTEAQKAAAHFIRLRDEEKEAYLFSHPIADRRSKSAAQVVATLGDRDENGKVPDSVVAPTKASTTVLNADAAKKHADKIKAAGKNKIKGVNEGETIDLD